MIKTPYLIQRGTIRTPMDLNSRLSQAVNFDYMGSAEFEWGALPKSFREIEKNADNFICRYVTDINDQGGNVLKVWSYFSDIEFAKYEVYLKTLRNPSSVKSEERIHTKEYTGFESGAAQFRNERTNFWWDIENQIMFGFDQDFMPKVAHFVANSLDYMNEQKANQ
jgi:hypothetical protein